ncbi:hypothetical protein PQX77_018272 [Marasmius sp. AFHP31]|nr:hypothetical protein PQX77_018272 [Marasmius sp. AFHP31]
MSSDLSSTSLSQSAHVSESDDTVLISRPPTSLTTSSSDDDHQTPANKSSSDPVDEKLPPSSNEPLHDNGVRHAILAHHRATNTWGNGTGGWGDDFETAEQAWATTVQSPKIVSLTTGRQWTDRADGVIFRWRSQDHSPSHRHIALYARTDLHGTLAPLRESRNLALKGTPSDKWARTLIIRSLPEAQHACIPGPDFTLMEVRERLSQVEADVASAKKLVAENLARMAAIREEQEPLRAILCSLDNERSVLLQKNDHEEDRLKELAEVQADLKDLEGLALTFC